MNAKLFWNPNLEYRIPTCAYRGLTSLLGYKKKQVFALVFICLSILLKWARKKGKMVTDKKDGEIMGEFWTSLLFLILGIAIGGGVGVFFTRKLMLDQVKKNDVDLEKQIRAMYAQMGRKPTEAQIRAIMKSSGSGK